MPGKLFGLLESLEAGRPAGDVHVSGKVLSTLHVSIHYVSWQLQGQGLTTFVIPIFSVISVPF